MLRIRRDLFHSSDQSREQGSRDDKDDKEKPGASKDQLDEVSLDHANLLKRSRDSLITFEPCGHALHWL